MSNTHGKLCGYPGGVMSANLPWYKRNPNDWQTGTRRHSMSMELRGFYSECLDAMWMLQGELPKDAKALSIMLGCSTRLVAALMPKLFELGKLCESENGFYNPRMMVDITGDDSWLTRAPVENQSPLTRAPLASESRTKNRKKPENTTRDLRGEEEEDKDTPLPPKRGPTDFDAQQAFESWNAVALRCALPQAAKLTPNRKRSIIARLKEYGLDGWNRAMANVERSSFLTGGTDRGFRADLDFVLQAKSFGKLHDGGYGNGRHAPSSDHAALVARELREIRALI